MKEKEEAEENGCWMQQFRRNRGGTEEEWRNGGGTEERNTVDTMSVLIN